jgi:DNA-binding response OmpR family regulator
MADVVIIEEDALMRSLLAEWLTAEGYRVSGTGDDDARPHPRVDLVIVDVYMPRNEGVERLRSARTAYPCTPIIAISTQFRPGVACMGVAARTLGVEGVIAKPLAREDLLRSVRSVIGPPVRYAG